MKASIEAEAFRQCFRQNTPELLWPTFESYTIPKRMYDFVARNSTLQRDINRLEKVQKSFIKQVHEM